MPHCESFYIPLKVDIGRPISQTKLLSWWHCKLVQSFLRLTWQCLTSYKMVHALLHNDLGIYSKGINKIHMHTLTHQFMQMFMTKIPMTAKKIYIPKIFHSFSKHLLSSFCVVSTGLIPRIQQWRKKQDKDDPCFHGEVLHTNILGIKKKNG